MRTRVEMKTVARENFRRCTGVFVAAAAILIVLGGGYGGITASNNVRNLYTENHQNLTVQTTGLSAQQTADLNQFVNQFAQSGALTATAAVISLIVSLVALALAIVEMILQIGFSHMALITSAGGTPKFGDFFVPFKRFGRWFGFSLMMGLRIFLWMLLFFIPGIIAIYRYSAATYLMLEDPNMGINESLRKSGELMRGYKGKLFVLDLSFILWILLTAITFGLVGLYLRPYTELTRVQFYYDLRREHPVEGLPPTMAFAAATPQPVAPVPPIASQPVPPAPPVPPVPPAQPAAPVPPVPPTQPTPPAGL